MKSKLLRVLATFSLVSTLAGCSWQVGGGSKHVTLAPTVGQQLIDLQKARDAGILTDAEFQSQKVKILRGD